MLFADIIKRHTDSRTSVILVDFLFQSMKIYLTVFHGDILLLSKTPIADIEYAIAESLELQKSYLILS